MIGAGSSSPIIKASNHNTPIFDLPVIPGIENQRPGSNRSQSMNSGEDYFQTTARFISENNSAPASPNSNSKYSVTFSPRITFFDTFPPSEYDRRGEIATCNRLTPMLAQQIKEELNSFKMVGLPTTCSMRTADQFIRRWTFMKSRKCTLISFKCPVDGHAVLALHTVIPLR